MYVLPFSPTEALVEYTLFSAERLPDHAYEAALETYIRDTLGSDGFSIEEREKGSIPMTCNDFAAADTPHITHIGVAGGWAKPSTGYTFWNCARNVPRIIAALKSGKSPGIRGKSRFWYYDLLLLDILAGANEKGASIFTSLFSKRDPRSILSFLQETTSPFEDLKIITGCPVGIFAQALRKRLLK